VLHDNLIMLAGLYYVLDFLFFVFGWLPKDNSLSNFWITFVYDLQLFDCVLL
jgi:hypothetical protein